MRLGVRGKLLAFFTVAIAALLVGSLTVVDRTVEANLRELLSRRLSNNQALLARFQRDALARVQEKLDNLKVTETIRTTLTDKRFRARDFPATFDPIVARLGLEGQVWVFNRDKQLVYPPALVADAESKEALQQLPVVATLIPDPPDDISEPPPPPDKIAPQVVRHAGSLWLLVASAYVDEELSVGAIMVSDDLGRIASELRKIAGGEADVAILSGASVLRTTLEGAARADLVGQLAAYAGPLEAVEAGERKDAQLELTIQGARHVALAVPVFHAEGQRSPGTMVVMRPLDAALAAQMARIRRGMQAIGLIALVLTLAAGAVFARSLTRPLAGLAEAMSRVAEGELDLSVERSSADEIGDLTEQFNEMVVGLRQKEMLKRMVSSSAAREIEERGRTRQILTLGGKLEPVTVLFSDIRNFTPMTEQLGPQIVTLLNAYFAVAGQVIQAHGGDIDKFIGDAVMIVFRDGEDGPGALKAVRCAAAMCRAIPDFNRTMRERGLPEIAIGIGIATGEVVAGNVGTPTRMENTVLGDTVNVAARLEGESKTCNDLPIMLDDPTYQAVADQVEVTMMTAKLKGKSGPLDIYELCSVTPAPTPEPTPEEDSA